jgi:hypothetical protein
MTKPTDKELRPAEHGSTGDRAQAMALPPATGPAPAIDVADLTRSRAKRPRPAVAAGVTLSLAGLVALMVQMSKPQPIVASPVQGLTAEERGQNIRYAARGECRVERWKACLDRLDEAREMDPNGDGEPDVQALRKLATERLSQPASP